MEFFAVSLHSFSDESVAGLLRCFSEEFNGLHKSSKKPVYWDIDEDGRFVRCCSGAGAKKVNAQELKAILCRKAALAMAEYILRDVEPDMIRAIAHKEFHIRDHEDVRKIGDYCRQLLKDGGSDQEVNPSDERERRKQRIAEEMGSFLVEQGSLSIEGFVTFRLAAYWEELREVVEYAVDEFVMDKQYQEFISLLRYFVCLQEVKVPVIHLIHKEKSEFLLFDERFKRVENESVDRIVAEMLETEMNMEDMVVSTLISVSPQRIIIHTREPELPAIRTIESIFEDRVCICCQCSSCSPFLDEQRKPVT